MKYLFLGILIIGIASILLLYRHYKEEVEEEKEWRKNWNKNKNNFRQNPS